MQTTVFRSALLAAALGFPPLALAATGAQTVGMPASSSSSAGMQHRMHHGMHHGMWRHGGDMAMLDRLDLTPAQRTSVRQMMREQHAGMQTQALMQKRMAFENATPGTAGYQAATDALAQAEAQAAKTRVSGRADMRAKIYNLLTSEQRTKLASLRSERQTRMQERHDQRAKHAVHKAAQAAPAATTGARQ